MRRAVRPSTWLARCGTRTHGGIKKRVLLASRPSRAEYSPGGQFKKRSRTWQRQAGHQTRGRPRPALAGHKPGTPHFPPPPANPDNDNAPDKRPTAWPGGPRFNDQQPQGEQVAQGARHDRRFFPGRQRWGRGRLRRIRVRKAGNSIQPRAASFRSRLRAAKSFKRPRSLRQSQQTHNSCANRLRLQSRCSAIQPCNHWSCSSSTNRP